MGAVVAEQPADQRLGLRVLAFAEVRVADVALLVDQVLGRPVLVRVVVPGPEVVVLHDRVRDAEPLDRGPHVRRHVLERELRRVHADDHEPLVAVGRVPRLEVRQRAQAVDARVRPEVDQHDLAAQLRERQRLRVDPGAVCVQRRRDAVVGQAPLGRLAHGGERLAAAAHLRELALGGRVVLELVLQERRVAGRERREVVVEVEDETERDGGHHRAGDDPHRLGVLAQPAGGLAAAERDQRASAPRRRRRRRA